MNERMELIAGIVGKMNGEAGRKDAKALVGSVKELLKVMAEDESMRLFRLARRAEKHGCSAQLVNAIREEGRWLNTECQSYPDRIVYWKTEYDKKYVFKM